MNSTDLRQRLRLPADAGRIVMVLVAVWIGLQVVGIVIGLAFVGRHGDGMAHHWDAPIHDWFVANRDGLVGSAEVVAFLGDAPILGLIVAVATLIALVVGWRNGHLLWRTIGPFVAYLGAETTVFVVRLVIHRPRPISANFPNPGALEGMHETSWSFPSGHATGPIAALIALAGVVALRNRAGSRARLWLLYAVAVVVGLAVAATRLVLGVHWFTDVTTGAVLGGTWGGVIGWAQRRCGDAGIDVSSSVHAEFDGDVADTV